MKALTPIVHEQTHFFKVFAVTLRHFVGTLTPMLWTTLPTGFKPR